MKKTDKLPVISSLDKNRIIDSLLPERTDITRLVEIIAEMAQLPTSGSKCSHRMSKKDMTDVVCMGWHEDVKWLIEMARDLFDELKKGKK